jgi:hypothetical protein
LNTLHGAENKAHFAGIDKAYSEYEHLPLQVAQKKLVDVLVTFSGLVNLRIVPFDYTEYLGGWPMPEQHSFIIPWHDFLYGEGTSIVRLMLHVYQQRAATDSRASTAPRSWRLYCEQFIERRS